MQLSVMCSLAADYANTLKYENVQLLRKNSSNSIALLHARNFHRINRLLQQAMHSAQYHRMRNNMTFASFVNNNYSSSVLPN